MTQKRRSPRKAGNGHKLVGWVRCNSIVIEAVMLAVFAGLLVWQGVAR